jgi:hypothetical protein
MNTTQLTPLAKILLESYEETAVYSRRFNHDYGQAPTMIAKVQHLLAVAQSLVNKSERYQLCIDYADFGKLQVVDLAGGRTYLVRSKTAYGIEDSRQQRLFPRELEALATPIIMVIHRFHSQGLDLSIAGTRQQPGRQRLVASGQASFIATWPYVVAGSGSAFEQGGYEAFRELGDIQDVETGEAG